MSELRDALADVSLDEDCKRLHRILRESMRMPKLRRVCRELGVDVKGKRRCDLTKLLAFLLREDWVSTFPHVQRYFPIKARECSTRA